MFRLVLLDGARVRLLLGDADRCQGVQNGLALDLQFPCKIVDANFAHLILLWGWRYLAMKIAGIAAALFYSTARLAGHISLIRRESWVQGYYPLKT
jgi:hypothetical protein